MTEIITLEVAKQRLDAVVAQYGADHKPVDRCMYFKKDVNGEQVPLCIVGAAFADELRDAGIGPDNGNVQGIYELISNNVLPATLEAAFFLSDAQSTQDEGLSWGEAVEIATYHAFGAHYNDTEALA